VEQQVRRVSNAATVRARLVFFLAAALALVSCYYSDANQVTLFRAHKSEYETLLHMLQHDQSLTFINSGLTTPEDPGTKGISPQRITEYRQYMSKIGCGAIRYDSSIGSAIFTSSVASGPDILYFPLRSKAEVAKKYGLPLDKVPAQSHHIEGDWYLSSENFR
jgi:hypothetical protein